MYTLDCAIVASAHNLATENKFDRTIQTTKQMNTWSIWAYEQQSKIKTTRDTIRQLFQRNFSSKNDQIATNTHPFSESIWKALLLITFILWLLVNKQCWNGTRTFLGATQFNNPIVTHYPKSTVRSQALCICSDLLIQHHYHFIGWIHWWKRRYLFVFFLFSFTWPSEKNAKLFDQFAVTLNH